MTPADLLARLEAEGVGVTLNLKVTAAEKPSDETLNLIRENRDALMAHLAAEFIGTAVQPQSTGLTLHGDLLHSLCVWIHRYHELRLERPGGVIRNAKPEHAAHHLTHAEWCTLYDETHTILATTGNVPRHALVDKNELQSTQAVQAAQGAVTAERVVN